MLLRFTKMHGLGNDFVVLDLITQRYRLRERDILRIADRHFGIGCDQILVVEHPQRPHVDFRYRIYNCDGSEVEQCGNGARCFAKFVSDKKLTGKSTIRVETKAGDIELELISNQQVRVNMGEPVLAPQDIPLLMDKQATHYQLQLPEQTVDLGAVSMGNPHCTLLVDDINTEQVATLGPIIESHPSFPERVNVGFMQVVDRQYVKLRVYERGAGETLACGSGACAAVVVGQLQGLLDEQVSVSLPGGQLSIEWRGLGHPVMMTGPATTVFEGQIQL